MFHGYAAGQIKGITESTSHSALTLSADAEHYPTAVAEAVDVLRGAGIGGPYGLALSPGIYTEIVHTAEHGGHLLLDHLRQILGGPLVWAPGVEGGIVLSLRGGDFVFESGQDISIGYTAHDADDRGALPRRELQLPRPRARRGRGPQEQGQEVLTRAGRAGG